MKKKVREQMRLYRVRHSKYNQLQTAHASDSCLMTVESKREKRKLVMDFKRNSGIALYLAGKSQPEILRELEHLKVNTVFVYRSISRYTATGSIAQRHRGGHQKTATSREMIQKVKKRLERNPRRSANQMTKELKISDRSNRRILKNNLKVKPFNIQKAHDLTSKQQQVRLQRAKELLRLKIFSN